MCWPLVWTEQRGHRCSHRWLATEGEAPGAELRSEASHRTFNVLVGAQPVPSIECSRSKLKHTDRQGGQQGAAPGTRGTHVPAPPTGALGLSPVVRSCPLTSPTSPSRCGGLPCVRGWTRAESVQAPVLSLLAAPTGLSSRRTRKFEAGQKHAPHGAPKSTCQPSGKS